jgi:hypothetical protein
MLLPDKYVAVERSILGQAANILMHREPDRTVSELWSSLVSDDSSWTFDRFAMALSLLFGLGVVALQNGILVWMTT